MKLRSLATVAILFVSLVAPVVAQDALHSTTVAPADEYFGHSQMSILGIGNHIHDADAAIAAGNDPAPIFAGTLQNVTDAIHDWQQHFPNDPWIASDLLALEKVYLHVDTEYARRLARDTLAWLERDYGMSDSTMEAETAYADASAPRNDRVSDNSAQR